MRAMLALLLVGCGTTKVVHYAEPMRESRRPPPIVRLDDVSPEFRRDPLAMVDNDALGVFKKQEAAKEPDARAVVSEANADADTDPLDAQAVGHTQVYRYDPDRQYQVYTCDAELVVLQFAPGEVMNGEPGYGNRSGWSHEKRISGDGHGHTVQLLELRPDSHSKVSDQGMRIFTNVGPYFIRLRVLPKGETTCMRAVRWRHPERELQRLIVEDQQRDEVEKEATRTAGCTSANYEIEVTEGSPRWVPTLVWRTCEGDKARVHIQFRGDVAWSKIPGLKTDGGVVDYRYVPEDHVMVVDGVFTRALLSLGSKETGYERVAIRALKEPR